MIWLDYLRHHHPGYRCIVIDNERLSQLPEDGNVVDAIPQSQVEAADVRPEEEDQEAEPDLEDAAAVPDLLAKDTELDALRSILVGEPEPELRLPNIRHTPINEFNRSHALLSLAFPCLFPDGRADFVEPRLRSIDYKDYIEHAMRWHDGRFARHPTFRFVAFNTLMRSQAPLTREQLIQALEHSEDPEAQALINSITRKRQDLEAYAYSLGCPGAFITFSPADLHWRSLYQHMPRYGEWLRASEPERMALSRYLLRQNPHIAAFHFYRRYCFFRDIVLRKKFNVTDYWDRYEWQGRGSPHNHGLYWMQEGPAADMEDEAARDMFARVWGFHVTAVNPEPRRTVPQGEGNPLSVDPLGVEMTFLRLSQIVNRCQRHRCNTTYCLRVRKEAAANVANPERECRFDFPRALRELAAVIRKEGRSYYIFEAARNDSLMNHFNPAIILGWDSGGCVRRLPPVEQHARSYRVDDDSYNLKTWRRLGANAKKRLMMAHPHRAPEELLAVDGQRFESFVAAYRCCRQRHHFHEDDHYGEVGTNELQAEDDEFEQEVHDEPIAEEDWHELARMLPDRPLEEEDIDVLGRRNIDVNYDWAPHVGRYTNEDILSGNYWEQRKAESSFPLDVEHQPLEARDALNPEQRIVYDTVMGHFLAQDRSQLLLHVDGGGNQISGTTLHSLLHLPINKDFRPLSAIDKAQLQKKLKDIQYLIIDEKSMLGLRMLSWIDNRLREAFPHRNEEFFGGLNILLVGDFFQLPPVLQKPLYYDKEVQGVEIKGRNAYMRFDKTVFLSVVQRQCGDDQASFRKALGELRLLLLSHESWKLLSGRVQAKLDDQEVARFANALRVYATKDRVIATNVGPGAAAAPDDKAGNLAKQVPVCIGARLMLTCNLWQQVGLCNGARGTVHDIGWAPGADPIRDQPKIVPIVAVKRDFLVGATLCTRTQFPLVVCYAITVHKSQSITEDRIVTDLSCRDFQTGLSYVAVSRVKTLQGLMLDAPFDRNHLTYTSPPEGIKMKMRDQRFRSWQVLTQNPYKNG
ncbi:PIF1-like helicase domain-containing protein [Hirsutella rhossiliensis]|uniref:ATP-dependent DNA helicase n=1 Tax=Hirsutella rhossiliensis TaxID=111463 RepID=A0A9P8SDC7_9HYPO|nr:PIF1-like helicase domain-containing protein [Hirsutella rhossiliensis]KAH0957200.1 PIF1-like helicase domain-containing protein [Hirsutella rhossiliensis]